MYTIYIYIAGANQTLRISGVMVFGPLEENAAMNGAGFVPSTVFGEVIYPFGFLSCIYIYIYK